jgi:hypothetical protein
MARARLPPSHPPSLPAVLANPNLRPNPNPKRLARTRTRNPNLTLLAGHGGWGDPSTRLPFPLMKHPASFRL